MSAIEWVELKGTTLTVTLVRVLNRDPERIRHGLAKRLESGGALLTGSPALIDLDPALAGDETGLAVEAIVDAVRDAGLVPVAVTSDLAAVQEAAQILGLAGVAKSKAKAGRKAECAAEPKPEPRPELAPRRSSESGSMVVTQPVRSGQSIYARGRDLVLVGPVSVGAEVMADGNIHAYGPLRGRALAGAQGDASARIFCRMLDAELVAVAGYYLTTDEIPAQLRGKPATIRLEGEVVCIEPL